MQNTLVITSPTDLKLLIREAVAEEFSQIRLPPKDPLPQSNYMTIEQAGLYLNLAKQTIYGYVSNRTIPFIKKEKKLYFEKEKLDFWLKEGSKQTKKELISNLKTRKQ